ncbi:unnamed protein product [Amaranthus hypochondriacus]
MRLSGIICVFIIAAIININIFIISTEALPNPGGLLDHGGSVLAGSADSFTYKNINKGAHIMGHGEHTMVETAQTGWVSNAACDNTKGFKISYAEV